MKHPYFLLTIFLVAAAFSGCAAVKETSKTVWGSSTRALDRARNDAITKSFDCSYDDCYREVLKAAELEEYTIFIKDKNQMHIVLMGVKGQVNTTEVGIFFTRLSNGTKVDVTSLSTNAKRKVADVVFDQLTHAFSERKAS